VQSRVRLHLERYVRQGTRRNGQPEVDHPPAENPQRGHAPGDTEADKQQRVIVAEAQRKSEILRGEGDAEATRVYAGAYGQDPEFFDFWRSMQAMQRGLSGNTTALVGTPDQVADAFLDYHDLGVTTFLIRGFDPLVDAIDYGRELLPLVRAKVAEREIALKGEMDQAAAAGNAEALQQLQRQLADDKRKLQSELEDKKDRIRQSN